MKQVEPLKIQKDYGPPDLKRALQAMKLLDPRNSGYLGFPELIQCLELLLPNTTSEVVQKFVIQSGACHVHYASFVEYLLKPVDDNLEPEEPQTPLAEMSQAQTRTLSIEQPESTMQQVVATQIGLGDLQNKLCEYVPDSAEDADLTRKTITASAEILAKGMGGAIIAVIDGAFKINFSHLDNGHLTEAFKAVARSLHDHKNNFVTLLSKYSEHSTSDRWVHDELAELADDLPAAAHILANLEGHPKDGAIVISKKGNLMGAAGHLKYTSERWQLCKSDGKAAGTRHNSSLALAEWLGANDQFGVIFVRSDDGGVHAILPRADWQPEVYHFDSLRPTSQAEMLEQFADRVKTKGQLMYKMVPVMARQGLKHQRIVTFTGDRVISDVIIPDDKSMVIRSNSVDHEHYVLSCAKFETFYKLPGVELSDDEYELKGRGFKMYYPSDRSRKYMYEVTQEDMDSFPANKFMAPFGEQPIRPGDFLAMPAAPGVAPEIYLMPHHILQQYAVAREDQLPTSRYSNSHHVTQEQMQEIFKQRIITANEVVTLSAPGVFRDAIPGERIVTCVQGIVTSDLVIQGADSKVGKGSAGELYVLPGEKFRNLYQCPGADFPSTNGKDIFLQAQGFRLYQRKPESSKRFIYEITKEDLQHVPTGFFESQWGVLQPMREGHYLATVAPAERAGDIWLVPDEIAQSWRQTT